MNIGSLSLGCKPKTMWIDKELLHVPVETYQRSRRNTHLMNRMRDNWDWIKAGMITVAPGDDGRYNVIDGGTRTLVAKSLNGEIPKLFCMVVNGLSLQDEAKKFIELANERVAICAIDKHRAAIVAKDEFAMKVDKIVTDAGYQVKNGPGEFNFQAITCLYRLAKIDIDIARETFDLCAEIACGDQIPNQALLGIFELAQLMQKQLKKSLFTDQNIHKLKLASMDGIMQAINKARFKSPGQSYSSAVCGMGILDILNSGKSTKRMKIAW